MQRKKGEIPNTIRLRENLLMTVFWDVVPFSLAIALIKAVSTSETSVNFYQTKRHNIPEDSHLHIRRRENLKSHQKICSPHGFEPTLR
jgi:hypothetical protein